MDFDLIEKILNLFLKFKSSGKSLEININDDLLKIVPIQRKLLINILREPPISIFSYLSDDENKLIFQNQLSLCQIHQNQSDSSLFNCSKLHYCEEFLLKNHCQQLKSTGQCSYSHSLSTKHNQSILSKFNLSSSDEHIVSLISMLIKISKDNSSKFYIQNLNQQSIDLKQLFDEHQSLIKNKQLINPYTVLLEFDDDEISSMMENYLIEYHSKTIRILQSLPIESEKEPKKIFDLNRMSIGRGRGRISTTSNPIQFSQRLQTNSSNKYRLSHRLNSSDNPNQTSLIKYSYSKPFNSQQILYLLGPGRKSIVENDQCQIVSYLILNSCQVKTIEQGKEIEENLHSILPKAIRSEILQLPKHLLLFVNSSIAEYVFQQNISNFAISTESIQTSIYIEIIQSKATSRSSSIDGDESVSDGKFHIKSSGSSIDVISGNIGRIPVDLMICISTSNNLLLNILHQAGPSIESQYKQRHTPDNALLLDGGSTSAKKILFVPWEIQIDQTESIQTQKSLSDLVQWCIEQAQQRRMKSISFPPIGTGQLGLDPAFVCEAMISAASQCLHEYQLDVCFVIYPADNSEEDECYQVFRIYLDSLCEQVQTKSIQDENQLLKKQIQSRQISLLFDSSKSNINPDYLIKTLEKYLYEKTIDLSLIDQSYLHQIENLIDLCLKSNVYPKIDYSRQQLILCGEKNNCYQCFFNMKKTKTIFQYIYEFDSNQTYLLNTFVSLNIDLASAIGETQISIEENNRLIYDIDLVKQQMKINKEKSIYFLKKLQRFHLKTLLSISTNPIDKTKYPTFECFQDFYRTMSIADWTIESIESIDNHLLKFHFNQNSNETKERFYYHCDYSSVQSIILYGLHWTNTYTDQIYLSKKILNSYLHSNKSSTDGKFYLFAIQIAKDNNNEKEDLLLETDQISLTLPIYLIVYQPRNVVH